MNNFLNSSTENPRSIKNLDWQLQNPNTSPMEMKIIQELSISNILSKILINRGVSNVEEARNFLEPKLINLLPNPFLLKDMDKALSRMYKALLNKEKITIFADYDVDGATSSAILKRFFKTLGLLIEIYVPDRIKEGYGPNKQAFLKLKESGTSLVITVDCGIVSFEPIEYANEIGLDVIVIDHHLASEKIPEAIAVINPNRLDDDFEVKKIAAVGVTFLCIVAFRSYLRDKGFFQNDDEPDLIHLLDCVALGTVCDVIPLVGINRVFVVHGLRLINQRKNTGIAALAAISKLHIKTKSYHLGFVLGPRINAGGRIGEGVLGANLLSTDDPFEALNIAMKLESLNSDRKSIEYSIFEDVIKTIEENNYQNDPVIVVSGNDWHFGIIGILASRIKEKYNKPAAVISVMNEIGKGSARSIPGVDVGSIISFAKFNEILIEGGGHPMAGGFSIAEENVDKFRKFFIQQIQNDSKSKNHYEKNMELKLDGLITLSAINRNLIKEINKAAPFGQGNNEPIFMVRDVVITKIIPIANGHMLIIVKDQLSNVSMKGVLYNRNGDDFSSILDNSIGKKADLACAIQISSYDDEKIELILADIRIY